MIDDKIYDRFLNTIRDGEADVGTIDIRVDGRWQTIDFRPALARLVAERDDAIAQMNDADSATDNATQIAERVVRELRQEYVDVINRLEKQSAAREEALRAEVAALRRADAEDGEALAKRIDDLNFRLLKETKRADDAVAENERLRRVAETLVAGARDLATYDGIARAIVEARKVLEKTPDASTPEYRVSLDFFPFRRRDEDSPDETCAECGRVDHPAFMCWRVGHLPKKETP